MTTESHENAEKSIQPFSAIAQQQCADFSKALRHQQHMVYGKGQQQMADYCGVHRNTWASWTSTETPTMPDRITEQKLYRLFGLKFFEMANESLLTQLREESTNHEGE